ncbi:MAG: hypothetical protein Q7S92_06675 [Candidatus Diapherotrites archaeon]|nr:hypothetical protein [Candidatus Diapherotrites archaeon]
MPKTLARKVSARVRNLVRRTDQSSRRIMRKKIQRNPAKGVQKTMKTFHKGAVQYALNKLNIKDPTIRAEIHFLAQTAVDSVLISGQNADSFLFSPATQSKLSGFLGSPSEAKKFNAFFVEFLHKIKKRRAKAVPKSAVVPAHYRIGHIPEGGFQA